LVCNTKNKTIDDAGIYVLMIGEFPTYRLAGWAYSIVLLNDANITDLGYGPTYALNQNELTKDFSIFNLD